MGFCVSSECLCLMFCQSWCFSYICVWPPVFLIQNVTSLHFMNGKASTSAILNDELSVCCGVVCMHNLSSSKRQNYCHIAGMSYTFWRIMYNTFKLSSNIKKHVRFLTNLFFFFSCCSITKTQIFCCIRNIIMNLVQDEWTHFIWWVLCLSFMIHLHFVFVRFDVAYRKNNCPKFVYVKYFLNSYVWQE